MNDDLNSSLLRNLVRPVLVLAGCVVLVALLLLPVAWFRDGSGGLTGLTVAAAVCLIAGLLAEMLAFVLRRSVPPLGVMLLGMAIRMAPPLVICLVLAAQRVRGSEHLAFIAYLLIFYLVTLVLETHSAIKRIPRTLSHLKPNGAH
jgi:hypothetical protein